MFIRDRKKWWNYEKAKYKKTIQAKEESLLAHIKEMDKLRNENKRLVKLLNLQNVSNSLPELVTEEYPNEWIASLKGIRGMIATGETEKEAICALMTSVKVMLLYNRQ